MGSLPSYKSVLKPTYTPLTARPTPPPVHPCHVRLPYTRSWAFSIFARSMEPGFARDIAFGKLSKDPLPLHTLRPQDHFVTSRKASYQPSYPCPLTCSRPFLPFSRHLARPLIACSSPCFGHGYICFNFVFQIRVWTLRRTHQTNHGGPSLRASYPLMLHVVCVGCCCLCASPFL